MKRLLLTVTVILSNVGGNLALSLGMKALPAVGFSPLAYVAAIFHPLVFLGVGLLVLWMLSRMALLSWADLSFVLPVTSVGYVLSAAAGRFFLQETVTAQQWLGAALIMGGTALVGLSQAKADRP